MVPHNAGEGKTGRLLAKNTWEKHGTVVPYTNTRW